MTKTIFSILILSILILSWCNINFSSEKDKKINELQQKLEEKNTLSSKRHFTYNKNWYYHWKLKIKWYIETTTKKEAFCQENCKNYTYLFFNVLETNNQNLYNFLEENNWSYFIKKDKIWIWCLKENNKITYYNESDKNWLKEYEISNNLSKKIINSNENSPIIISLNMPILSLWSWAPTCYSYFKIIDN